MIEPRYAEVKNWKQNCFTYTYEKWNETVSKQPMYGSNIAEFFGCKEWYAVIYASRLSLNLFGIECMDFMRTTPNGKNNCWCTSSAYEKNRETGLVQAHKR